MKAHLGNPAIHSDADRKGLEWGNKNKTKVGRRKRRIKHKSRKRKKISLNQKRTYVKLIKDISKNEDENKDRAIEEARESLMKNGCRIRKDYLFRWMFQAQALSLKYPGAFRSRIGSQGNPCDVFLRLHKSTIEKILSKLARIPNITREIFFEYLSERFPMWRLDEPDASKEREKRFYRFRNFLSRNHSGLK